MKGAHKRIGLKVCGMVQPANIMDVAELRPDFMGFIFYANSPRYVGENFEIPDGVGEDIRRVGVFVNQPKEEIEYKFNQHALQYAQLHGGETAEFCQALKLAGLGVIKAFGISEDFDFGRLKEYEQAVDYFLFDTRTESYGGSGRRFDWSLLRQYNRQTPFLLSGGIGPGHVDQAMALEIPRLAALDINSTVESGPGFKDLARVRQVIVHQQKFMDGTEMMEL